MVRPKVHFYMLSEENSYILHITIQMSSFVIHKVPGVLPDLNPSIVDLSDPSNATTLVQDQVEI